MKEHSLSLTQRRIRKQHMPTHLKELQALTGRVVCADELESLDQLYEMQSHLKEIEENEIVTWDIPFSDRNSGRFKGFIERLKKANPSPIYIFAENSDSCGTLLTPSLDDINFNFEFSINGGLLEFIASDYRDCLLLDFSLSDTGEKLMGIIRRGKNWSKVDY